MSLKMRFRDWVLGVPGLIAWYVLDNWNKPYRKGKKAEGKNTSRLTARLRLLAALDRFVWKVIGG